MDGKSVALALGVVIVAGIVGLAALQPNRVDGTQEDASRQVAREIADIESLEAEERSAAEREQIAQAAAAPKEPMPLQDTEPFTVTLECSNGKIVIECHPEWSPLGVARFKDAVEAGIYDNAHFFRVVPGFVVQFGIPADPNMAEQWREATFKDDPVTESNVRGTVTFATSGPNSRTTQMFINLGNNARLDGMGFSPIGKVIEGMDVVDAIEAKYGEAPNQGLVQRYGAKYLNEQFPDLDYIKDASVQSAE